jgi:hypothetical protein
MEEKWIKTWAYSEIYIAFSQKVYMQRRLLNFQRISKMDLKDFAGRCKKEYRHDPKT